MNLNQTKLQCRTREKKVSSYTLKYKLGAIAYAENDNISFASKKFNVDRKRIREWKDKKEELLSLKNKDHGSKRKNRFAAKYNYLPGNIIAMDETPVWADMVSDTTVDKTGARTITMKSTGHEKCRVSVCLTAKADGSKLKPFIVFKNAKR